jgi:hypothetical protein
MSDVYDRENVNEGIRRVVEDKESSTEIWEKFLTDDDRGYFKNSDKRFKRWAVESLCHPVWPRIAETKKPSDFVVEPDSFEEDMCYWTKEVHKRYEEESDRIMES